MVAGHDRGGRVAYRMALDFPGKVLKVAALDIIPNLYESKKELCQPTAKAPFIIPRKN